MPPRIAENFADLPTPDQIGQYSGLEFLQAMIDGDLPGPPIAATLGYYLERVAAGEAVFRGAPGFNAMNPIGVIHGGWFGTLLDSCMACAVQTMLPKGKGYTTLEYKVNILRPLLPSSGEMRAIGRARHVGRRTGVAEGEIVGVEDGKLYATGSTTCIVIEM